MLRNYFTVAFRIFSRQKVYTLINIGGLAIGLAGALLIFGYIMNELNYDEVHPYTENTYRIATKYIDEDGNTETWRVAPALWSDQLKEQFPDVQARLRIRWIGYPNSVFYKEKDKIVLTEELYFVDPDYGKVLNFDVITGDKENAFREINSVAINESTSELIFGSENPIGKVLSVSHPWVTDNKGLNLIVTAVFKDYPSNTSFKPSYLVPLEALRPGYKWGNFDDLFTGWLSGWMESYVVVKEGTDINTLEKEFAKILAENIDEESVEFFLVLKNIFDLHFDKEVLWFLEGMGDITHVYIFGSIGFFLILIASINYINLATARSARRSREVGLRKVMGSNRFQLIFQFFNESFIITFSALIISLIIIALVLPVFNNLAQKDFVFSTFFNFRLLVGVILLVIIVTILAGSYPSFYLSRFDPVEVFKVGKLGQRGSFSLRKALVIFQFSISLLMLICSGVLMKQINYITDSKLNEQGAQMISIRYGGTAPMEKYPVYKNTVLQDPDLKNITTANHLPRLDYFAWIGITVRIPDVSDSEYQWSELKVDFDFPKVFNLEFIAGRDFIKENPADSKAILINKAAAKILGIDPAEAVGIRVEDTESQKISTVIGVVQDFPYRSVQQTIGPLIISSRPDQLDQIVYVRLPVKNMQEHIQTLESKWKEVFPGIGFDYWFLDDEFNRMYESEIRMSELSEIFTLIAIFIACLGLFGLASFMTEQSTSEIGIRKVFGASVTQIMVLFLSTYVIMLIISIVVAGPLGYFMMNKWLQQFVYRISVDWKIILSSIGILLGLTILTISYELIKASTANPVDAIKHE